MQNEATGPSDPHRLDGDHDGIACEALPITPLRRCEGVVPGLHLAESLRSGTRQIRRAFMVRKFETRAIFSITNPNKGWVVQELDKLRSEWAVWHEVAQNLADSPDYNPQTCTEAIKDGFANRRKHDVLREKTVEFIGNDFSGYEFLFENWPSHPHEDNTSRLAKIIPGWLHRLETLSASVEYARVPDSYWKAKGKELVDKVVKVGPDKAAEIAASYLKNPTSQ